VRLTLRSVKLAPVTDSFEPGRPASPEPIRVPGQGPPAQRVSDAERDQTVTLLREHVVVGRLTLDEFSERIGLALVAHTRGDLAAAMTDLPTIATPQEEAGRRRARRRFVAVMSGATAKGRWRIHSRTTAVAVMGGCDLDLRQAEIDGPEVVITAVAFWGGINIIVPEGFDVELEGFSFMGGRNLKLRNVPLIPGSPRIRVRGFAIMGGIDVRSRRSRPGREIGPTIVDHVLGTISALPSMPSLAGVGTPGAGPIDLESLGRDIREQIRAQRVVYRQNARERGHRRDRGRNPDQQRDSEGGPPGSSGDPAADPTAPEPPVAAEGTVTILFSDMVDYAGMTERLGDRTSREVLRDHHQIVRGLLTTHGGREIKVQGDGFMVAFGGVARALRCASDMQRTFSSYSETHRERPIQVHIGIHTGEAMEEDDDFLGHTVIVASRIADIAGPGEIVVSSVSAQMVERTEEFTFDDHREVTLKGLSRPQGVATLAWA
jgi:class 3 adenylate cyclase